MTRHRSRGQVLARSESISVAQLARSNAQRDWPLSSSPTSTRSGSIGTVKKVTSPNCSPDDEGEVSSETLEIDTDK
jgi:hypothetical protein